MQDKTVDVAADAFLGIEVGDLRKAVAKLPIDEQEFVRRTKLDDFPITIEAFAELKGVTVNAIKLRIPHINAKIRRLIEKNIF